jgi:hypothetical protein
MSICELIRAGNMNARLAAMFWIAIERGASMIVAADPPNSGKTTTLSALLAFAPPETLVYFTRGHGETFSLPAVSESYDTYILVNEMSDHIPVYTWDDNARRVFELLAEGYRLGTTMHDNTVEGVLGQLENDLAVPRSQLAHLTFVVPLYVGQVYPPMRRVQEVALVEPDGANGLATRTVASWDMQNDTFAVLPAAEDVAAVARWAGASAEKLVAELDRREAIINGWLESGATSIPEVNNAIEAFYEEARRLPANGPARAPASLPPRPSLRSLRRPGVRPLPIADRCCSSRSPRRPPTPRCPAPPGRPSECRR